MRLRQKSHVKKYPQMDNVVYDSGAKDMPELHQMMLSGFTPSTRVGKYYTDISPSATDSDILDSIPNKVLDVTDVINSKNVADLNKTKLVDDSSDNLENSNPIK